MFSLGTTLKLIREEKGLTQEQATDKIGHGVTRTILANIESGRSKLQADIIPYICNAYNCSPNYIYSYHYKSERQYRDDFDKQEDLIQFFDRVDSDYLSLALYIANSRYFKGSLLEEAALVVCENEVKKPIHKINWAVFKQAVEDKNITDDEIVSILLKHEQEFKTMCNQL